MPLQHSEDCSSSDIPCNDSCQLLGYVLKAARFARYTRFWIRGRCWYNTSGLPGKGPENKLSLPALSTSLLHAPRCLSSFAQECPRMCRKNGHRGVVCDTKDSLLCTPASYCKGLRLSLVESGTRCQFEQMDGFFYNDKIGSRGHKMAASSQ